MKLQELTNDPAAMRATFMAPHETLDLPAGLAFDYYKSFIYDENEVTQGQFGEIRISSNFQPIYSLAHRRSVGYEALVRARSNDNAPISPLDLFGMAHNDSATVFLDLLCRIVHIGNFRRQQEDSSWLFLNIDPLATISGQHHGKFFSKVLEHYGIAPHRVVVEILEGKIHDENLLAESVAFFKELGCLVAIDDFGAGHSNFDRIWRLQPQLVKLDRRIITQAASSLPVRRVLPNLINMIHEAGSLALIEGIETEQEALVAMDTDVDFVQGYYFAKPAATLPPLDHNREFIEELGRKFVQTSRNQAHAHKTRLHDYHDAFEVFYKQFKAGVESSLACKSFLSLPCAERCYLLDRNGKQLGPSLGSPNACTIPDPRFLPLSDSQDATWLRRQYFRSAINAPGEIQVSRPYLSIAGGNMCVTFSVAVFSGKEIVVLCADLLWDEPTASL